MIRPWRVHAWLGGLVLVCYLLVPVGIPRDVVYAAVGLSSVAAIVAGIRLHRPDHPAAWYLMAIGQLSWVTGDLLFGWYADVLHVSPFPSPSDEGRARGARPARSSASRAAGGD